MLGVFESSRMLNGRAGSVVAADADSSSLANTSSSPATLCERWCARVVFRARQSCDGLPRCLGIMVAVLTGDAYEARSAYFCLVREIEVHQSHSHK